MRAAAVRGIQHSESGARPHHPPDTPGWNCSRLGLSAVVALKPWGARVGVTCGRGGGRFKGTGSAATFEIGAGEAAAGSMGPPGTVSVGCAADMRPIGESAF
jgi:hypothetical protein